MFLEFSRLDLRNINKRTRYAFLISSLKTVAVGSLPVYPINAKLDFNASMGP